MSGLQNVKWINLTPVDLQGVKQAKEQFHKASQSVAATGRHFLEASPQDENAVLSWDKGIQGMVGKWIPTSEGTIRAGLRLPDPIIFIQDEFSQIVEESPIRDKTFSQLMIWFEEKMGARGLPVENFSAHLPYELPEYASQNGKPLVFSDDTSHEALVVMYDNCYNIMTEVKQAFDPLTKTTIWPHHFDEAISIKLKDSGDPDTSTFLGLGFSPGDDHYDEPYFYVNSWPYAEDSLLKSLPAGDWHTDEWVGAFLKVQEIWSIANQKEMVYEFLCQAGSQIKEILLQ